MDNNYEAVQLYFLHCPGTAMLPSFPRIEDFRRDLNMERLHRLVPQVAPMLGMINRHVQFEGGGTTIHRYDDTVGHSPMQPISAEISVQSRPVDEFNGNVLDEILQKIATQFANQVTENTFKVLTEATKATGNVIDGGGQPLTEEMLLAALEKMEHSFEPDGTWNPPTLVTSPALADRLLKQAEEDPARTAQFDAAAKKIVDRKRDDFRRREAGRVLVG